MERFDVSPIKINHLAFKLSKSGVPTDADQATIEKGVNFPTLQRVIGNTT
jgi:putative transposase